MSHFSMRRRGCVLAVTVAAVAATPFAAAPAAHATGGRTVTRWLSSSAHLAVHDPRDVLGRPGDTHELHVNVQDTGEPGTIRVVSFDCGAHDPARTPQELGCSLVEDGDLVITAARATPRSGSVRWRAATDAGALRLALTGGAHRQWVSREWELAEGTRRETGRETLTQHARQAVTGTLAGLALTQPAAWRTDAQSTRSRAVARVSRGPAVPLPDLPPAGTGVVDDESTARSSATWVRPLPDGTALYGLVWGVAAPPEGGFGPMASAVVSRQRCDPGEEPLGRGDQPAPGRCDALEWLADDAMAPGYAFTFDNRLGTADLSGQSSVEPGQPPRNHAVTASWQGGEPVGVRTVQRSWDSPEHGGRLTTSTVSGIRWLRPAAQVTWEGGPVHVTGATVYASHARTRITGG
jgi:hypothetical protein